MKRKADRFGNIDEEQHKRRRLLIHGGSSRHTNDDYDPLAQESASSASSTTSHFLDFHLQLLKSLYENAHLVTADTTDTTVALENDNDAIPSDTSSPEQQRKKLEWNDGPVDPSVWTLTEAFLSQRSSLCESKKEATRLRGIDREAKLFIESRSNRNSGAAASNNGGAITANTNNSTSPLQFRRLHSPILAGQAQYESPSNNKTRSSASTASFGILARLLHRQFQAAHQAFHDETEAYGPLVENTNELVEKLQDMLRMHANAQRAKDQAATNQLLDSVMHSQQKQQSLQVASPASSTERHALAALSTFSRSPEEERCRIVHLQTKLKLWRLLTKDLEREIN